MDLHHLTEMVKSYTEEPVAIFLCFLNSHILAQTHYTHISASKSALGARIKD